MSATERLRLRWSAAEELGGWQVAVLTLPEPPLAEMAATALHVFCQSLRQVLTTTYQLYTESYLQVWKLGDTTGARVLAERPRTFRTELGLGLWPDREQRTGWTQESMADAAAAVYLGNEPELPSYRLLRLICEPNQRPAVLSRFAGHGVLLECFSDLSAPETAERLSSNLLPLAAPRRLEQEPFCLPLLSAASARIAAAEGTLGNWLSPLQAYLRFSPEDRGLLLLSRLPIPQLLERAHSEVLAAQTQQPRATGAGSR